MTFCFKSVVFVAVVVYGLKIKGVCCIAQNNTESRLVNHLLEGYDTKIRPVINASKPIHIDIGLMLKQIINVDFSHQILTLHIWLRVFWKDEYISWKPEDYDGISSITLGTSKLWIPDIVLYNSASLTAGGSKLKTSYQLKILHSGNVTWSTPSIISSECKVNVRHFPFDLQHCTLEFGSWGYGGKMLDVGHQLPYIDTQRFSENSEWKFDSSKTERLETYYDCCSETWPTVKFTISLKRKPMFYLMNLIVPCGLITAVSLCSFFLPPNSGERVSLVITVLLSLSVYMMIVTDEMPHSADTPLASKFFLFLIAQQAASLAATCIIINLHNNSTPLPLWLDVLVNNVLARLLCMRVSRSSPSDGMQDTSPTRPVCVNECFTDAEDIVLRCTHVKCEKSEGKDEHNKNYQCDTQNYKSQAHFRSLLKEVRVLSNKCYQSDQQEKLQSEWDRVTAVLDRFFLFLLISSMCISFITIFFAVP